MKILKIWAVDLKIMFFLCISIKKNVKSHDAVPLNCRWLTFLLQHLVKPQTMEEIWKDFNDDQMGCEAPNAAGGGHGAASAPA
jgi:hypothetical protein